MKLGILQKKKEKHSLKKQEKLGECLQAYQKILNLKAYSLKLKSGFTLIELLIVIGISVILAAAATPLYGSLQVSSQLNENSSQIIQALRLARERSINGFGNMQHGVFFDIDPSGQDSYVLYRGASYATRQTSYDRAISLDDVLSFSSSGFSLSGTDIDINFSKTFGRPNNRGTLTLTHEVNGSRSVVINFAGKIEEN